MKYPEVYRELLNSKDSDGRRPIDILYYGLGGNEDFDYLTAKLGMFSLTPAIDGYPVDFRTMLYDHHVPQPLGTHHLLTGITSIRRKVDETITQLDQKRTEFLLNYTGSADNAFFLNTFAKSIICFLAQDGCYRTLVSFSAKYPLAWYTRINHTTTSLPGPTLPLYFAILSLHGSTGEFRQALLKTMRFLVDSGADPELYLQNRYITGEDEATAALDEAGIEYSRPPSATPMYGSGRKKRHTARSYRRTLKSNKRTKKSKLLSKHNF
jgi:hypothetical protein